MAMKTRSMGVNRGAGQQFLWLGSGSSEVLHVDRAGCTISPLWMSRPEAPEQQQS